MNTQIQELLEQAGGGYFDEDGNALSAALIGKDVEKFAMLIVRECLKIVEPTEDSGDEWCVTLKGTAQEIKQHFGVE
ncbi:MAG: hypothetical protein ACOVLB_06220 [Candidatus Nanopelagicus sp.]